MQEADGSIEINLPRCDGKEKRGPPAQPGRLITVSTDYLSYHINRYLLHRPGTTATAERRGGERRRIQRLVRIVDKGGEEDDGWTGRDEEGMIRRFGASGNPRILGGVVVSSQSIYRSSESENYIYTYRDIYVHIYKYNISSTISLFP